MKILLLGDPEEALKAGFIQRTLDVVRTEDKIAAEFITSLKPDWIISYNYRHLIKQDIISLPGLKLINLHISLLPWNRGADPNPWSHLEGTPKGITIHEIDLGIDTGPILCQKELFFKDDLSLSETYQMLNREIIAFFWEKWPHMDVFLKNRIPQSGQGSFHTTKDRSKFENCLQNKGWDISISDFKKIWQNHKH